MKRYAVPLALLMLLALIQPATAQVKVEITLEQDQYLAGESLVAAVRIINTSGQALHLGGDNEWLTFSMETAEGQLVPKNGEAPVAGEFVLETSKTAIKRVDIAPWFALSQVGRYEMRANVRIKQWGLELHSMPKSFTIINGTHLWEQEFGVPDRTGDTNAMPEVRKYMLQQANYLRGQLRLYLRITDARASKVVRVLPIGDLVSFSTPEHLLDKSNNLHVIFANGARTYKYVEVSPDGELIVRQQYEYTGTRPRLKVNDDGAITVIGGLKKISPSDVTPAAVKESDDPKKPNT